MIELHEIWEAAESASDLPPVPPLDGFERCYEEIDVGYDCFIADAYAHGPYALVRDEEAFRRDLWGWSARVSYRDGNRYASIMPACKLGSAEEARRSLADYVESL